MSVFSTCAVRCRLRFSHRLHKWPRRLWIVLLCGMVGAVVGGCPPTAPPMPPPSSQQQRPSPAPAAPSAEQQRTFAAAEALRTSGKHAQALQAFTDFTQRYPSTPLTDDALLAIGKIAALLGDSRQALHAYQALLDGFPASEHVPQAYLGQGMLFYHMQDFSRSLAALRQYLTVSPAPEQQAIAHYYLGSIARQQQRYPEAIRALKMCVDTSADATLVKRARTHIARIVRDHLTVTALEQLARQYPDTYPGDVLLSHLALEYRAAGNTVDEIAALQRFTAAFPEHPNFQAASARLRDLQASLTTDRTKIGVLLPLSGEESRYGRHALQGIELALTALRERQPGLEVSLVIRDSRRTAVVASEALRSLVNEDRVISVIGPLFSHVALDLAPLADQLEVPLISPYAPGGHFPSLSTYAFRNSLTDALQGRFMAEYAIQVLNLKKFIVLYPDEAYGITLKDIFIEHVLRLQGRVVIATAYPPDTTDFSQQIRRLGGVDDETLRDLRAGANSEPAANTDMQPALYDAIFIPDYYNKVGLIAPGLAFYNITGIQLLGTDGWNAPELVDIGERFVEGAIFADGFFPNSPSPLVIEFVERFRARYQQMPDLLAAQAYDTLLMLAQVLQSGAKTRTQLRDGLLRLHDFAGVSGTTTIGPDGNAEKTPYLLTIREGRIVQLN